MRRGIAFILGAPGPETTAALGAEYRRAEAAGLLLRYVRITVRGVTVIWDRETAEVWSAREDGEVAPSRRGPRGRDVAGADPEKTKKRSGGLLGGGPEVDSNGDGE